MEAEETYQWLMENGGPIIRYRTATELMMPDKSINIQKLKDEMLASPLVKTWLERIVPPVLLLQESVDITPHVMQSGIKEFHGGQPERLENVLGKLTDFGLKKGIPELDRRTLPYRKWLADNAERPIKNVYVKFTLGMLADFLVSAGYIDEPGVKSTLIKRLKMVYDFTRKGDYDIYIPNKYIRKYPCIKLELTPDGDCYLPLIYDIVGWAAYLPEHGTQEDLAKADSIFQYILDEKYQNFPWGYGIMGDSTGRTWSLGWSVHVPQYPGIPDKKNMDKSVVHMISLLANFKAARQHQWFKESMSHLESFRTEKGTYLFPPDYLEEKTTGYWVLGVHMGLEETKKRNLEVESTFWMAKFQKILKDAG